MYSMSLYQLKQKIDTYTSSNMKFLLKFIDFINQLYENS